MADGIISAAERLYATYRERCPNGDDEELHLDLSDGLRKMRDELDDADNRRFKEQSVNEWLSWLEQTSFELDGVLDRWDYYYLLQHRHSEGDVVKDNVVASTEQKSGEDDVVTDNVVAPTEQKSGEGDVVEGDIVKDNVAAPNEQKSNEDEDDVVEGDVVEDNVDAPTEQKEADVPDDIADKLSSLMVQFDLILGKKEVYSIGIRHPKPKRPRSTPFVDSKQVHGRESDMDILLPKLISEDGGGVQVLSISGMAGIGKTTLAQLLYNDARVQDHFKLRLWVPVSDHFDGAEITKAIIDGVKKSPANPVEMLVNNLTDFIGANKNDSLTDRIKGKKFLLVLDDVCAADHDEWEPLKQALDHGGGGSKIMVTTRNQRVAKTMNTLGKSGTHRLAPLPVVRSSKVWESEAFPHLLSSYNELSAAQKRCFSYCAVFAKSSRIEVAEAIQFWAALGYLGDGGDVEVRGRDCFVAIADQSLFQDLEKGDIHGDIESFKLDELVHDFAEFIRSKSVDNSGEGEERCEICHPLLISKIREFRSVFLQRTPLLSLCPCLSGTRLLGTRYRRSIPRGVMENLIHLRWLDLSNSSLSADDVRSVCKVRTLQALLLASCGLAELPSEMSRLINLRHLSLMGNDFVELPLSVCGLLELRFWNVDYCYSLCRLPSEICRLTKLTHFYFEQTRLLVFPYELGQLKCLNTVSEFRVGSGWTEWGLLRDLNRLSGSLKLRIKSGKVGEIREAELEKKVKIQEFEIVFEDEMDALELNLNLNLNLNLQILKMWYYKGLKIPVAAAKLDQLNELRLQKFINLESLPPLGELGRLEKVYISGMEGLKMVGREFLGMNNGVGFPRLRKLTFEGCPEWVEWEDITAEEEESAAVSIMPCLKKLRIMNCIAMKKLPYRLLRKAAAMEELNLYNSEISRYSLPSDLSKNPLFRVTDDY